MTPQTPERTNEEIANAEAEKWYTEECFKCPTFFGCFIEGYLRGAKAKDTLYQREGAGYQATIERLRKALKLVEEALIASTKHIIDKGECDACRLHNEALLKIKEMMK